MGVSFLLGGFNVYGSPLSNNIRLSHKITLTDVIIQIMISYLLNYVSKTVLEISMLTYYITLLFNIVVYNTF